MNVSYKSALAVAALALTACTTASAADLNGGRGSLKDGYAPMAPHASHGTAGPCYFRVDAGYSWSSNQEGTLVGNVNPEVRAENLADGGLLEGGLGCSMGSLGLRSDLVLGARQERKFKGDVDIFVGGAPIDPPIQTTLKTYTMMFNTYYDFGQRGRSLVPYVGAGIGFGYHKMGSVTMDHPLTPNVVNGEDKLSFAWALMAGVGYQVSDRAILDIGYRYIDLGLARGSHGDNVFAWNPRLEIDDQRAHEFKVGLRYHFDMGCCGGQSVAYAPMK